MSTGGQSPTPRELERQALRTIGRLGALVGALVRAPRLLTAAWARLLEGDLYDQYGANAEDGTGTLRFFAGLTITSGGTLAVAQLFLNQRYLILTAYLLLSLAVLSGVWSIIRFRSDPTAAAPSHFYDIPTVWFGHWTFILTVAVTLLIGVSILNGVFDPRKDPRIFKLKELSLSTPLQFSKRADIADPTSFGGSALSGSIARNHQNYLGALKNGVVESVHNRQELITQLRKLVDAWDKGNGVQPTKEQKEEIKGLQDRIDSIVNVGERDLMFVESQFFDNDFLSFRGEVVVEQHDPQKGWKRVPLETDFKAAFLVRDDRRSFRPVTPAWRQIPFELERDEKTGSVKLSNTLTIPMPLKDERVVILLFMKPISSNQRVWFYVTDNDPL